MTLPNGKAKSFEYDPAGRMKTTTLASPSNIKQTTVYEFSGVVDKIEYRDAANSLVGTDDFTYNDLLQRTSGTGRYGVNNAWTYDDRGRMLTESTTYSGQTYQVGYRYDSRGRLDEITYPSGRKAAYTFDQRGALDLIKWESSTIEDRGYDDLARLNNVDRPGVDETRSYDDAGRLTAINNTNVGDATYTYDANHNKLSESWTGAMAAWNFLTTNTGTNPDGYVKEDRFVHFKQATQSKTFDFGRSDIGNINNINLNGTGTTRGFNNIHALTSIGSSTQAFDENGNQTTSHAGHTQSWDEAGMMKQSVVPAGSPVGVAGTNEYGYDVDRKRAWKKITRNSSIAEHTVYIHAGPNLIAEYPAGTAAASPAQEYVYAQEIDSLVMLVRSTGGGSGNEKLAITRNQQWSVTALTDATSGTVLERYTYDHFGKRTILEANGTTVRATSSYNMPFGYTSRQHDSETGLMYFRARYYDPVSGEFTSPDPLEYVDGMSLFRGYFVFKGVDPTGRKKTCSTLSSGFTIPGIDEIAGDDKSGKLGQALAKAGVKLQLSSNGSCQQTTCSDPDCCDQDHVVRRCNLSASLGISLVSKNPGVYYGGSGSIQVSAGQYAEWGGCPNVDKRSMCFALTGTLEGKVCAGADGMINGCLVFRITCESSFCMGGGRSPQDQPHDELKGGCRFTASVVGCFFNWCSEKELIGIDLPWPKFDGQI